ncbi:hypothetical protein CDL15_Pgr025668 [Punica granatum]|uniref:FLZ-type domain-containing protein n=1 Tax=Punica granatum TaxID=22663 RepID=A0A218WBF0_PUNGR|nr:hypothetical protein CDL15_Pgr025668 [Punica granatum]PKI52430.1 hypothetical protein CRG98_027183 [Punica granatum]
MAAEHGSLPSPVEKPRRPSSPFFSLPRLFTASNPSPEAEPVISPTSTLDSKPFSGLTSFWSEASTPRTPEPENKMVVIGSLGLVEVLKDEEQNDSKPSKMVLFGSQLRIQVPPLPPSALSPASDYSPRSPSEFGIKTRNSQSLSPSLVKQSASSPPKVAANSPRPLSASEITEMESSEDYTCVISYGPNPKTVHIFGDCIVESCCGEGGLSPASSTEKGFSIDDQFSSPSTPSDSFLSFCHTCKKNLGPGSDIYMYRGEIAFCSGECRYQEMLLEERHGKTRPR